MNIIPTKTRQQALQLLCFIEARPDLSFEQAYHIFQNWLPSLETEDPSLFSTTITFERPNQLSVKNLVHSTLINQETIDSAIKQSSHHWRLERMSWVDRNLLRLAVYELLFSQTPPKILINEAIELAKKYSSSQAAAFINGILDSVYRNHNQKQDPL